MSYPARELALASAGSGKTYHLTSRYIGLLARGRPVSSVLASTFTRKAAGEILERILTRLCEACTDPAEALELAIATGLTGDTGRAGGSSGAGGTDRATEDPSFWVPVLEALIQELHRSGVGTLDAYMMSLARTFSAELALPPRWTVVQGIEADSLLTLVMDRLLDQADPRAMVELLSLLNRGDVTRGVHGRLLEQLESLVRISREVDESVPWGFTPEELPPAPSGDDLDRRVAAIVAGIRATPLPMVGDRPNKTWASASQKTVEALLAGEWQPVVSQGIVAALARGSALFSRKPIESEVEEAFRPALELARAMIGADLQGQAAALRQLAGIMSAELEATTLDRGTFRFEDLTYRVGQGRLSSRGEEVSYRLDARYQHVLLDEFQDTSSPQWSLLEPLVDAIVGADGDDRELVVVADPKQSIYGWRGGHPELVEGLRRRTRIEDKVLDRSYRSSQVILETAHRVFTAIPGGTALFGKDPSPVLTDVVGAWLKDLHPQTASEEREGYVQLMVASEGDRRISLTNRALECVQDLHARAPELSIGVLVRKNRTAGDILSRFRQAGLPATGEGGAPLTDTPAVNVLLALLRLADHPGDRICRYHVGTSPLARTLGAEALASPEGSEADHVARSLSHRIRGLLLREGMGAAVGEWIALLAPQVSQRDLIRLRQLQELAFAWTRNATLRPADFVRMVEKTAVPLPGDSPIRVMTIHGSKGLEFDAVVLPELHPPFFGGGGDRAVALTRREDALGPVVQVYPAGHSLTRPLFPGLQAAWDQHVERQVRDALSTLYVAMTRARFGLYMVIPPDTVNSKGERTLTYGRTAAGIVREALAPDLIAEPRDPELATNGNADWVEWWQEKRAGTTPTPETLSPDSPPPLRPDTPIPLPQGRRGRNLPRRSPSSLEGGPLVSLSFTLGPRPAAALDLGTLVHAWCEALDWSEEGLPPDGHLLTLARELDLQLPAADVDRALDRLHRELAAPEIHAALSRSHYAADTVTLERELPFAVKSPDGILQGYVDRLVLEWEGDRVVGAHVLDFKTDQVQAEPGDELQARVSHYTPQLNAYRTAMAELFGLAPGAVSATLLFLTPGRAVDVPPPAGP